jgi:hypothetical protein
MGYPTRTKRPKDRLNFRVVPGIEAFEMADFEKIAFPRKPA